MKKSSWGGGGAKKETIFKPFSQNTDGENKTKQVMKYVENQLGDILYIVDS